ncbi:MAG TPA: hypothetical protein VI078_14760 [bacterium]
MTIAACYLSSEGVVLGSDSTTTIFVPNLTGQGDFHFFNHGQKIYEFGNSGSTVGVVLWGLGSLGEKSYRTLIAEIADEAWHSNLATPEQVVHLARDMFWSQYTAAFRDALARAKELERKGAGCTPEETRELGNLRQNFSGGFCLAGRWGVNRSPKAFEFCFNPLLDVAPDPNPLAVGTAKFWGLENLIQRLLYGIDAPLIDRILGSGKWNGTDEELFQLIREGVLGQSRDLPLREAVDWIYSSIYITIKTFKFSHLLPLCGGPIEIAVISSDRSFRWVRHKELGEAITAHRTKEDKV